MKKISSFKLLSLSMSGFKCFAENTVFAFDDMTVISGANGLGKSTIADAIAYAFVGTPFFGERKIDRLLNDNSKEISVELKLADEHGEVHTLNRTRKNDTTSIVFDGINLSQTSLCQVFGEKDEFLSIFNPLYFIDVLGEDGKALLEKMLPIIPHEEIIEKLDKSTKDLLLNESLLSPETYIKNRRDEIRELEQDMVYMQGQSDLLEKQQKERDKSLSELRSQTEAIEAEIQSLSNIRDNERGRKADDEQLIELYRRRDELASEKPAEPDYSPLIRFEAELGHLYDDHKKIASLLADTKPGHHCSACLREITADNLDEVKGELSNQLAACVSNGKDLKARISELKQELNARTVDVERYNTDLSLLGNQIQELMYRQENGALPLEQVCKLTALGQQKRDLDNRISGLMSASDSPDLVQAIVKTEQETEAKKRLVSAAVLYIGKKYELLFEGMKLNKVNISLYDVVKTTGEIKDCFKFTYDGRSYKSLSLSEKIRAGLEVSELVKRLSGREYPIFVDNMESVCAIDNIRPEGQMFFARVVKGEKLSVTGRSLSLRKAG